ncbi:PepSY domain-containing protein [Shouchella miscanthi]|uniref:PepSY domain-containing protein n=1 Tax=Shouchella miscanthi TaxID=2598861 RepID=UPI0011A4D176|nr:PepSY domain-containing protein [Shouchella miscanthi]
MKKQTVMITGTCALLVAGGATWSIANAKEDPAVKEVTAQSTAVAGTTASSLSLEQAVKQAEEYVGGNMVKAKQDVEDGVDVYEVDVRTPQETYEFTFDVQTGDLIDIDGDLLLTENKAKPALTQQEAETIAVEKSGLANVKEIELEQEKGLLVYKIEFAQYDDDVDLVIDAETGDIVKMDDELLNSTSEDGAKSFLSLDEVTAFIQSELGEHVTILESERDYDDGIPLYELEVMVDNVEYDIDLHAETGDILKQERDE